MRLRVCCGKHHKLPYIWVLRMRSDSFHVYSLIRNYGSNVAVMGMAFRTDVCCSQCAQGSQLHAHGVDEPPHEPAYGLVL